MHPAFQARLPREHHPPRLVTLIPLALAVAVSILASAAAAVALILNTRDMRHLVDRIAGGDHVSSTRIAADLHHHHVVFWVALATSGASLIVLIAWSVVAQRNAERIQGGGAGSVLAVLAWIIPVVNLWVPPRILAGTRSAQLMGYPRTHRPRSKSALILLWWLLLLADVGLACFILVDEPRVIAVDSAAHERNILALGLIQASVCLAGSAILLGVVAMMTWTNEELRRTRAVVDVELPLAPVTQLGLRPRSVSAYPSSIFPVAVHPSDPRWKPEPPAGEPGYWT